MVALPLQMEKIAPSPEPHSAAHVEYEKLGRLLQSTSASDAKVGACLSFVVLVAPGMYALGGPDAVQSTCASDQSAGQLPSACLDLAPCSCSTSCCCSCSMCQPCKRHPTAYTAPLVLCS